ncbi:MAG: hypothetical protein AAF500_18320 [Myxococcota bacterium]
MRRGSQWVVILAVLQVLACTGRKQVPFGLEASGGRGGGSAALDEATDTRSEAVFPTGESFDAGVVEVPIDNGTLVLETGYALAALRLDLDGDDVEDAIVVSATPEEVHLLAGYTRGITVQSRPIDAFAVPSDCVDAKATLERLSESLVVATVDHTCETGPRRNWWIASVEAQPRVRERVTTFATSPQPAVAFDVELRVEDTDSDGYDDVVAEARVGDTAVPLTWLDRPGGFSRDSSQPEATFQALASQAAELLATDPKQAAVRATEVLEAFAALCREGGRARIGLSGTRGLQCGASPGTAKASAVATEAAIRQGRFVRALELQRDWSTMATTPSAEDRARIQAAWQRTKGRSTATWTRIDAEAATVPLYFEAPDTLVVGGRNPRRLELKTGTRTQLEASQVRALVRDPANRFEVTGVRVTCAGYEAVVRPVGGKQTRRVVIERASANEVCRTPIDRPANLQEWTVLGWAPQGLVAASGDRIRIVPVNASGKAAGRPIEIEPGSPLPAPTRGNRITPTGTRYVIPHAEGIIVRDWQTGATGLWLRPSDWDNVPGEVRSVALSPDGRRVALQKGSEIRLVSW